MKKIRVIKIDVENDIISEMFIVKSENNFKREIGCNNLEYCRYDANNYIIVDADGIKEDRTTFFSLKLRSRISGNALIVGISSTGNFIGTNLRKGSLSKTIVFGGLI